MHRALVVEDDLPTRVLLSKILERRGFHCDAVAAGDEAIARLRRESYCAVLLDLLMPVINGFEVLQFVRAERAAMLPRVVVITSADEATLQHFDPKGLWMLLRKPINIGEIEAIVVSCAEQDAHEH